MSVHNCLLLCLSPSLRLKAARCLVRLVPVYVSRRQETFLLAVAVPFAWGITDRWWLAVFSLLVGGIPWLFCGGEPTGKFLKNWRPFLSGLPCPRRRFTAPKLFGWPNPWRSVALDKATALWCQLWICEISLHSSPNMMVQQFLESWPQNLGVVILKKSSPVQSSLLPFT